MRENIFKYFSIRSRYNLVQPALHKLIYTSSNNCNWYIVSGWYSMCLFHAFSDSFFYLIFFIIVVYCACLFTSKKLFLSDSLCKEWLSSFLNGSRFIICPLLCKILCMVHLYV